MPLPGYALIGYRARLAHAVCPTKAPPEGAVAACAFYQELLDLVEMS